MFPLLPGEVPKRLELLSIPRQPVVVEVSPQDLVNRTGLQLHGLVPHPAESLLHRGFRAAEPLPLRLKHRLDGCLTDASSPVNREAKKRQFAPFMGRVVSPVAHVGNHNFRAS